MIVTNTPDVLTQATAELALALTLAAGRRMSDAERDLREGRWEGWDPAAYRGLELRGSTVGVIGMGRIGSRYAELVRALGAEVLYTSRSPKPEAEKELGARRAELRELLEASDVVSVHAPASEETHHLIGAAELDLIGPEGVLVNTSRGPLVDADAVAAALKRGPLRRRRPGRLRGRAGRASEPARRPARGAAAPHRLGDGPFTRRDGADGGGERDRRARGRGAAEPGRLARPGRARRRLGLPVRLATRGSVRKTTSQSGEETPKP